MKKSLWFLILILVGLESFGQKHPPVFPYNESGYTLAQFRDSLTSNKSYNVNVYQCLIDNINESLRLSRRSLKLKEFPLVRGRHDDWIFEHFFIKDGIVFENGFTNSYKNGNVTSPFWDKQTFRGSCFVFGYDGLEVISAKTICMNLIKSKFDFVPFVETIPINPEPEPETIVPEDKHFTVGRIEINVGVYQLPEPFELPKEEKKVKKEVKIGKIVLRVGEGGLVVAAIYFIAKALFPKHTSTPILEPRTMPPGLPATEPAQQPGLDSDPRSMPSGSGG